MFVLDTSASMQPYVAEMQAQVDSVCKKIEEADSLAPGALRVGLVAFDGKASKSYGFLPGVAALKRELATVAASGEGGPVVVGDALDEAAKAEWDGAATKVILLITGSASHGVDGQANGAANGGPSSQSAPCPLLVAADILSDRQRPGQCGAVNGRQGYHLGAYESAVRI